MEERIGYVHDDEGKQEPTIDKRGNKLLCGENVGITIYSSRGDRRKAKMAAE